MPRIFLLALLLLPTLPLATEAVVTRVVDGDTLEADGRDIRLQGIDAPESGQPYGGRATAALKGLVLHRRVRLEVDGVDRYGRLIAAIYSEGQIVNHWLVRTGHAWEYDRYSNDSALRRLEREARKAR